MEGGSPAIAMRAETARDQRAYAPVTESLGNLLSLTHLIALVDTGAEVTLLQGTFTLQPFSSQRRSDPCRGFGGQSTPPLKSAVPDRISITENFKGDSKSLC